MPRSQCFLAMVLLGALIFGCAPAAAANGTVYYVAESGSDANPGSLKEPWRTIAKASQELEAGDTVYIRGGAYDEYIQPANSGTPGNKITYTRFEDEEVVIRGQPGTARLVALHNQSYIVVDGLTLSYGHPPPEGDKRWPWVYIGEDAHHNVIRNCTIFRAGDPLSLFQRGYLEFGIVLNGTSHNVLEGNTIAGVNQGIHLKNAPTFNSILNNTITGTGQSSIVVGSSKGAMQGNLIEGNILERSAVEDGIQFMEDTDLPHGPGRKVDISNLGTIIRGNIIRYHNENAIDLKGTAHVVIEGNLIYGIVGSSNGPRLGWNRNAHGSITRGSNTSTRDVIIRRNVIYDSAPGIRAHQGYKIYHNTLVANNRDYTGSNSDWTAEGRPAFSGIRQKEPEDGDIAIQNNIIVGHNTVEVALWPRHDRSEPTTIDGNLYHNSNGVFFGFVKPSGDWEPLTFSMWRRLLRGYESVAGNEWYSLVADPRFVNAPGRPVGGHEQFDFRLQDGSPAIDRGRPLTWTDGKGSGNKIKLDDAGYFMDGYGVVEGDLIQVGHSRPVRVKAIDYQRDLVAIDRSLSWQDGEPVSLAYNGSAPDIGAFECEGECAPAVSPPWPSQRVSEGLQALYSFDDGEGPLVRDVSGVGSPLHLKIEDPAAVQWTDSSIVVRGPTLISSIDAATKITEACHASNELTVEAWIKPEDSESSGPAGIVALAPDGEHRNFAVTLGMSGRESRDLYGIGLRTTEETEGGGPNLSSLPGVVREAPTHVVLTRDASGFARLYINNELHAQETVGGNFSNWDRGYPLVLGNGPSGDRPWLGSLYLVAVYCRALDGHEVWQNYAFGLKDIFTSGQFLPAVLK